MGIYGKMYAQLAKACTLGDVRRSYDIYYRILTQALDKLTEGTGLTLNGLYARINHLIKEHGLSRELSTAINGLRHRIKDLEHGIDRDTLERWLMQDFRTICEFIEATGGERVPDEIKKSFPDRVGIKQIRKGDERCIRMSVSSWDKTYIHGTDSAGRPITLRHAPSGNSGIPFTADWSYLTTYLSTGSQLNIVEPRIVTDICYPELIIYEPDFLVDVSSIAGCFTNYACDPIVQLLAKIKPQSSSEAIMLGFLAGQLLDEEVHSCGNGHDYDSSYEKFIRNNAFNALTTEIGNLKSLGEEQLRHIHTCLSESMTNAVGAYDSGNIILEPSFFCEMLGLQGRMDMLQLDYKVLLEQKSGKGGFPEPGPEGSPVHREEHYVQLLLYRAILHYAFGMSNDQIHSFLLYSRYEKGLVELGQAPSLLLQAINIRNGIVWHERKYCGKGLRILDFYAQNPEQLNLKRVSNTLWTAFQLPSFRELLSPLTKASDLERAYFYRFMSFLETENMISKVGDKEKDSTGFASKWRESLQMKKASGSIYDSLDLNIPPSQEDNIKTVQLMLTNEISADTSNFRKGDIVIFYPYAKGSEPDARKSMVFRGTLVELAVDHLEIELRAAQSDRRVFEYNKGKPWAVEHDSLDSSATSLYRGLYGFLSAPKERKDLLLLQRDASVDDRLKLRGDYGEFNELALRVKQARDLFLIIGPPGTGKTSFGMLNTVKEELLELEAQGSSDAVLVMAYTNRAVDEICSKLVEENIDFLRLGHTHSCAPEYRKYLLSSRLDAISDLDCMRAVLSKVKVVVGTTSTLNGHINLFAIKTFSLAVIDEASQILEPHLLGLLGARSQDGDSPAIRKFVMIGDHKQLPAVVQQSEAVSKVNEAELNDIFLTDCRLSMFERLLKKYRHNPAVSYMLTRQGRMHHDIASFPDICFYQGRLEEVPLEHQRARLNPLPTSKHGIDRLLETHRFIFLAAEDGNETGESDKINVTEAEMIAATVVRIYLKERENFDINRTVGVIVPYRNQIAQVRNCLDSYGYQEIRNITIDTVERFQGSQRDYIIYGFTARFSYQLKFLSSNTFVEDGNIIDRKLNVAMTRARKHLVLLGDPRLLSQEKIFRRLMEYARGINAYYEIPPDRFVKGEFEI